MRKTFPVPVKIDPWIILILLVGLLTYSCAIWWGLPTNSSWAADAIHPLDVIEKTRAYPYPPLHFYILRLVYTPAILAAKLGGENLQSIAGITRLMVLGRATSVAMTLGIILNVYFISLEVSKKRFPALLSAAFVLGNAPLIYYAKVMNVDVPYIFWFSLSLIFYLRAIKFDKLIDYSLFALISMLSICTKDQAYGLIAAPTALLAYRCFHSNHKRKFLRLLIPTTIGIITFLAIHNIVFNFPAFEDHFNILGKSGYTPTNFTHAPTVYLERYIYFIFRFFKDIQFNLGWPMFIISLAAVAIYFLRKNKQNLLLYLLIPCVSYYVLLLSFIMYSRDRFVIPICLILYVFCGHLFWGIFERFKQIYIVKQGLFMTLAILFAYSFFYANSVNLLMLSDSRYFVETWMVDNINPPATVGFVEKKRNHPRFTELTRQKIGVRGVSSSDLEDVIDKQEFSYLITSSGYAANRFPEDHKKYQGFARLTDGVNYKLVFCRRSTPLWNLLNIEEATPAEYYDPRRKKGNLNKINPEICIYEKHEAAA